MDVMKNNSKKASFSRKQNEAIASIKNNNQRNKLKEKPHMSIQKETKAKKCYKSLIFWVKL